MHINKETMPELTLLIDSKLGRNRSADGSTFEYPLEPALMVPFDAEPTLRVLEANVFYTSPNVSVAKSNNKLKFSVITSGTVAGGDLSTTITRSYSTMACIPWLTSTPSWLTT